MQSFYNERKIVLKRMFKRHQHTLPLITIGIVVLNREWIIEQMLKSVQKQTYPHERLALILVDGESKDKTVEIASRVFTDSDFLEYQIIVKKSNIPEARNICIKNMKGEFLLFWDSDVLLEPDAISRIVEILRKEDADIVYSLVKEVDIDLNKLNTTEQELENHLNQISTQKDAGYVMGNTLIKKKVLSQIKFDSDLTFFEDKDFSNKAKQKGYKVFETRAITGFDINTKTDNSDIYRFNMPLKEALRGINKKATIQAQEIYSNHLCVKRPLGNFLLKNRRYLFYIGYIPAIIITTIGFLITNIWVESFFLSYFLLCILIQLKKRGISQGLNAAARGIIVGIPTTYALLYQYFKINLKK